MARSLAALAIAATVLAGCNGGGRTDLSIEVVNGFGEQHYRLTCQPPGGDVPHADDLCGLLADNADVMLFRPKNNSTCIGGFGTIHLHATGRFDGAVVDATEIDACQGNPQAERLWLSGLAAPIAPPKRPSNLSYREGWHAATLARRRPPASVSAHGPVVPTLTVPFTVSV
jgi:hypothetical protein